MSRNENSVAKQIFIGVAVGVVVAVISAAILTVLGLRENNSTIVTIPATNSPYDSSSRLSDSPASPQTNITNNSQNFQNIPEKYRKLKDDLEEGDFSYADLETLEIIEKNNTTGWGGFFKIEDLETVPCRDWQEIDRLWLFYSKGMYGFRVQKKIWIELGGKVGIADETIYKRFKKIVEWDKGIIPLNQFRRERLSFEQEGEIAVRGQLPL